MTFHYLLSARRPEWLPACHFGSKTHQFVSDLSAAATIKLKLMLLALIRQRRRPGPLARATQRPGAVQGGHVDVCCI